jgi:hypothetical protein
VTYDQFRFLVKYYGDVALPSSSATAKLLLVERDRGHGGRSAGEMEQRQLDRLRHGVVEERSDVGRAST